MRTISFPSGSNLFIGAMAGHHLVRLILNGNRVAAEEAADRLGPADSRGAAGAVGRCVLPAPRSCD